MLLYRMMSSWTAVRSSPKREDWSTYGLIWVPHSDRSDSDSARMSGWGEAERAAVNTSASALDSVHDIDSVHDTELLGCSRKKKKKKNDIIGILKEDGKGLADHPG